MSRISPGPARQRGAALLLMMLFVLVAATTVLVSQLDNNTARARKLTDTAETVAIARTALIDFAKIQPDLVAGAAVKLPCPDIDDSGGLAEGVAHADNCGPMGETVIGRLPWRTLGIEPPRDGAGACLWYVVSGSYKDAGAATSPLINPDSNGQLQLWGIEAGQLVAGAVPADRPVALIVAPMHGIGGQIRAAPAPAGGQCSSSFDPAEFLDTDSLSGISNATLSGAADVIDVLAGAAGYDGEHNDRVATITRADLARVVEQRHDFDANMRALGLAVAACVADYARKNPGGGGNDYRLPWPAPVRLTDYRIDADYDDADSGVLSGRLPDRVDDSSAATGNPIVNALTDCDVAAVPDWSAAQRSMWRNWKDHFFYAVAESFKPDASVPSNCTSCLTVNGSGQYAAVILFAGSRLSALSQVRDAPPIDADTRDDVNNYLEMANAANIPYAVGSVDFLSQAPGMNFNDRLFCIDASLTVSEC